MPGTEVTFDTVRNGVWLLHVSPAVKFSRQPQTIIPREASKLQQIDQFLRYPQPIQARSSLQNQPPPRYRCD